MNGPPVFGAAEVRHFCRFDSRKTMRYWRDPKRGDSRLPEPYMRINGGQTEVWEPGAVMAWFERTREQRGFDQMMNRTQPQQRRKDTA